MFPLATFPNTHILCAFRFSDHVVQQDKKNWPFKVVEKDDKPYLQVIFKGKSVEFSPEEISAMVLLKMKESAETYLGHPVQVCTMFTPTVVVIYHETGCCCYRACIFQ